MKLLAKDIAQSKIKKNNDELVDVNIRLRKSYAEIISRLNTAKLNYEPEKIKAYEDFERFCKELKVKKSKLLEELNMLEAEIERKKDLYYGLIAKQDQLDEKVYQINEKEKKLDLREKFILDIEQKIQNKQ